MNKEASLKQAGRHLGDAVDADADCLVTPVPAVPPQPRPAAAAGREGRGPRARHAGPAPAPARRARARARPEGARACSARRQADVGDRLVDVGCGGRRSLRARAAPHGRSGLNRPARVRGRACPCRPSGNRSAASRATPGRPRSARRGLAWYGGESLRHRREGGDGYDLRGEIEVGSPEFLRAAEALTGAPIAAGNDAELLINGDAIFPAFLETIRPARADGQLPDLRLLARRDRARGRRGARASARAAGRRGQRAARRGRRRAKMERELIDEMRDAGVERGALPPAQALRDAAARTTAPTARCSSPTAASA